MSSQHQAIQRILAQVDALGLFPQAAMKIHQVASDPESTQRDMEQAISLEPALSAQILRLANAPFYGLRRNVSNLRQAIFVLGFRAIQGLAMSLAVMHMGRSAHPERRRAWKHALAAGIASRRFAARLDGLVAGDAFVSALLHDLGETLLMEVEDTDLFVSLLRNVPDPVARLQAEQENFGCDHARLGAACLEAWGLPDALCHAVQFHHEPAAILAMADPRARRLAEVVWMADQVDRERMAGGTGEGLHGRLCASGLAAPVDVGAEFVQGTLDELAEELERLAGEDPISASAAPGDRELPRRTIGRRRQGPPGGWRRAS